MKEAGLYIHIPFCKYKCLYCDFYSAGVKIADWNSYSRALLNELQARIRELNRDPVTLYLGGGTPSLLPAEVFSYLIENVKTVTGVTDFKEFTIEVNPEDVSPAKCEVWKRNGVNRVSLGIQTLDNHELKGIGRRHSVADGIEAINTLKKYFENISLDLMFGIPGQTTEHYKTTLERIIELDPKHISSYSLMLEEGTALTLLYKQNRIKLPDEDEWLKMFEMTSSILKAAGYRHYEISNYAKPGFESQHNTNYWLGNPYLGLGPGAHSYDGERIRRANPTLLKEYIKWFSSENSQRKEEMFYEEEILSGVELSEEMIMTRLRTAEGLDLQEYHKRFSASSLDSLIKKAEVHIESGNLQILDTRLKFTEKGIPLFDKILVELF